MRQNKRTFNGFALYEVLLGVTIFVIGVLALGRSVENCLNASALNEEENRVRQILANRMAEIQTAPLRPDNSRQTKIDTGYGIVKLSQKSAAAELKDEQGFDLGGISLVTLTAEWSRQGVTQSKQIVFYVYRAG
jgi:Tfp pilus assembly protein PilV